MPKNALNKKPVTKKIGPQDHDGDDDPTNEVRHDPYQPIPLELENIFGFDPGGKKYIPFFAGNDNFYGFNNFLINILNARLQSTTTDLCIATKVDYTLGDGIYSASSKEDKRFEEFKRRVNNDGETFNDVLRKVIDHFYTFGNVPIEIVRTEVAGKRFLYVYATNPLVARKAWPDSLNHSNGMIISRWFMKRGAMNLTYKFSDPIPFYRTGTNAVARKKCWVADKTDNQDNPIPNGTFRTSLWIKRTMPGYDHYGIPSWLSSKIFGMLEYGGAQFNLDNLDNNMVIGGMLVLAGSMTDDEIKDQGRRINRQFIGKGKGGKVVVVGSEGNVESSKYTPFNTHKEGSYVELDEKATRKIIMAHQWHPALLGDEKGSLGKGGSYVNEIYQQKVKTVIKPLHRIIKDQFLTPLCEIADEWLGTNWKDLDLDIQISNLFDDTTEATTTVAGLTAFLEIVKLVGSGVYPLDAAIQLVMDRFGKDQEEAKRMLGNIVIQPNQQKTVNVQE